MTYQDTRPRPIDPFAPSYGADAYADLFPTIPTDDQDAPTHPTDLMIRTIAESIIRDIGTGDGCDLTFALYHIFGNVLADELGDVLAHLTGMDRDTCNRAVRAQLS
jgi:hypothetical protein